MISAVGCLSILGGRERQQDEYLVTSINSDIQVFAVFDGHGMLNIIDEMLTPINRH